MIAFTPNTIQRRILWGAIAIAATMLLFPPFHLISGSGAVLNHGYSFILDAPEIERNYRASVNLPLLFTQWLLLAVVTGVALLLTAGPNPRVQVQSEEPRQNWPPPESSRLTPARAIRFILRSTAVFCGAFTLAVVRSLAHDVGPEIWAMRILFAGGMAWAIVWVWVKTARLK